MVSINVTVFVGLLVVCVYCKDAIAQTRVVATAPLATVKEGGILSLHCQIWRQNSKQTVVIAKRIGTEEARLTWDKLILEEGQAGKRYFLAYRKLKDSSDVYFLSITDVTRQDEGDYVCIILQPNTYDVVNEQSVSIGVRYFPSEGFPVCNPTGPQTILEGTSFTLNCSSESGKPPVKINWSRTGSESELLQTQITKENTVYSEVTFNPKLSDQDAMFVCKIESKIFPNRPDRKCHIGPLKVEPNPHFVWPITTVPPPYQVTEPKYSLVINDTTEECHEVCAAMTSESVFRWTIATVISGLLALVFFMFGIVLLIRYCVIDDNNNVPPPQHQEEIPPDMPDYPGVQYRIDGNRLYMTLERPSTSQTEAVYQGGEVFERQYILAPSREGEYNVQYNGTPFRRESESPYYLRGPDRRDSEKQECPYNCPDADLHSNAIPYEDDMDRPYYQGTPVHNGGSLSLQGTPTRIISDKVLTEAQSEGYIGTPTRRESEGYIGTCSRVESERLLFGTPTRGESERQRSLTPTLPPRRYKSHYV